MTPAERPYLVLNLGHYVLRYEAFGNRGRAPFSNCVVLWDGDPLV